MGSRFKSVRANYMRMLPSWYGRAGKPGRERGFNSRHPHQTFPNYGGVADGKKRCLRAKNRWRPGKTGNFCKGCYEMERTIEVDLGCFVTGFKMTIDVPGNRDAEEYIDEYLDTILNINLRYNCDWVFVK